MKATLFKTTLAATCLLSPFVSPAGATLVGPGANISDAIDQDTPGQDRLNVDGTALATLPAGSYDLTTWSINVYDHAQGGTITPMLLSGTPGAYTTVWVGAAFDPTINGVQNIPASGSITLASSTDLYAGFFTSGGGGGIIALDANNSGSGNSSTDHDGIFTAPTGPGESVTGFSNPGLGRTYAFGVYVSNHTVRFLPINSDLDCGISDTKTYTHAIDFGDNSARPTATVNGVVFSNGGPGAFPGPGGGSSNLPNSHPGSDDAALYLGDGTGMKALVGDMIFGAADGQGVITLTGLTPGQPYEVRLYNRQWGPGLRNQTIGFDTDGVGTDISGAEDLASFNEDDASAPDPALATATQVNALTYKYTLAAGVSTLTIYVNSAIPASSYHLYGLTNELAEAPVVVGLTPADEETDVGLGNNLEVTFNDHVALGSGNITIKNLDLATETVITLLDPQVSVNGVVMTIDPTALLEAFTDYAIQLDPGVVTDLYGVPFAGIADDLTWNFTTGAPEAIPPTAISFDPADDSGDVGLATDLVITFDEPVQKGSGIIRIKRIGDDFLIDTIDVTTGNVVVSGAAVTITPNLYLSSKTGYYVEIDNGAIKDLVGNDFAGISGDSTWSFDTTNIYFVAISGDADCGIDTGRDYTHAIDFGDNSGNPTATINGVVFANGGPAAFPDPVGTAGSIGTGGSNLPTSHPGNGDAAAYLTGSGMRNLVGDMIYGAGSPQITLTGLTPGVAYQVRLFHRRWVGGSSVRAQAIGIDTDGLAGAESTAVFDEDNALLPDPGFATDTQVHALTYDYVLAPGVSTLTIDITNTAGGSYHLYGLTNEVVDLIPPVVTATSPLAGESDVLTYTNLEVSFDDQMLIGSGDIRIKNLDTASEIVITVPDPQVSVAGDTVTINPDASLAGETNYAIQIDAGALTDSSGNPFAGILDDVTWYFQTGIADLTDPIATDFSPADDEADVDPTTDLVVTFDEPMTKGSGSIVIRESAGGTAVETIDVNSGNVTIAGAGVTINPSANLTSDGSYYVEIDGTALTDLNGNPYAGLAGSSAWNLTTRGALVLRLAVADYDEVTGVWTDSSGLGNDATAPSAGETPALVASQTSNGSSIVSFDGDDSLNLASGITPLSTEGGYTVFAYLRPEAANTKSILAGSSGCFQYRINPGPGLQQNVVRQEQAETGTSLTGLPAGTSAAFSSINAQVNGLGGVFRLNGFDDGGLGGSTYSAPIGIIGRRAASDEIFIGDIAEIRIYDRQLSLSEILAVEAELEAAYSTPYVAWAAGYVPADVSDLNGDNDNDQFTNLLEFGFGTNPTDPDSGPLGWDGVNPAVPGSPVVDVSFPGGGGVNFKARFMRRKDHDQPGSAHYRLEFSSDMTDWETSDDDPTPAWVQPPAWLADDASGDYELVEVPYPFNLPGSGKKARFFRVTVSAL